ncbi:MAG: 3-phosphoshikimate 1-carboxyvinyltransferase [Planctomycetota bacterium]|nr:MAG: 3-phosphoshikimate 1-carboxyvinyltransferase [Planctomycetota bacterium]
MAEFRTISPVSRPVCGVIRPPGSKSLTNRALVLAALAEGESRLTGVLDSDDTRVMIESLRRLGLGVNQDIDGCRVEIKGGGGRIPADEGDLELQNSGTSIRFLTALCCLGQGVYRLDGNARMRERPIQPLIDALESWQVDVRSEHGTGCPPVLVRANGLRAAAIRVSGEISSQYLSALLMVAPCADGNVSIEVQGELVSRPYVDMTLAVMRSFGGRIEEAETGRFRTEGGGYRGTDYKIEPDASAASYFFAAAAVTGGEVTVQGLSNVSLQGDIGFVDVLENMGCTVDWGEDAVTVRGGELRGVDVDMNAISDTAQTLACVAPFAVGPTHIRNVEHMRAKETDRVSALVTELRKLGLDARERADGLTIVPGEMHAADIATYDDHRMAMSFAILGLRQPGVRILDPGCTAKTYPNYFADLDRLCVGAR